MAENQSEGGGAEREGRFGLLFFFYRALFRSFLLPTLFNSQILPTAPFLSANGLPHPKTNGRRTIHACMRVFTPRLVFTDGRVFL